MARAKLGIRLSLLGMVCAGLAGTPALASPLQSEAEVEEAIKIFNRAKRLHQEKQYHEAIREYRQAIELDEENPFVYNAMGLALAAIGSFDEALRAFAKALALNPEFTDVHNNMGMVYAEQGAKEKAFEAFGRAVRNPSYVTPEKPLFNLGNLYLEDGNPELALIHFKRAIEREPRFALGHRGLGKTYLLMEDEEQAIIEFERALDISEDDAESLYQLARIRERHGAVEEARALYRRVVEIDRFSSLGQLALASLDALKGGS